MKVLGTWILALTALLMITGCGGQSDGSEREPDAPVLTVGKIRAGMNETVSVPVSFGNLDPAQVERIEFTMQDPRGFETGEFALTRALFRAAEVTVETLDGARRYIITPPVGGEFNSGSLGAIEFTAPGGVVARHPVVVTNAAATVSGQMVDLIPETGTAAVSLLSRPISVAAFLCAVVATIYWFASFPALAGFFRFLPPLIWMYFIPMISTTVGITPDSSVFYSPFMSRFILPAILILLLIPSNVSAIAKLGPKAIGMLLFGAAGICIGAIFSFWLFHTLMGDQLPEQTWKAIAALAGSWIGGSPNMTAVLESVGTPPGLLGPLVVVDTVLAYSWLGTLIALSSYQASFDKFNKADTEAIEEISLDLEKEFKENARTPRVTDIAFMLGIAMAVSQICMNLGEPIYSLIKGLDTGITDQISAVVSASGWGFLLITAAGLALSTTKVRTLDFAGASAIGYIGLYLLLTTYGARADLRAVLETPVFFGIGIVWLMIHIGVLYLGLMLLRAPLFLGATSSMANIGGTASAPVVAAAYNQSMAPVGLLMAILGGTLGTPLALFVVATACRAIASP